MSLQVAIMKVLASYPDGRASVAAMKSDLAILAGAGPAWCMRLKRLAARAPDLDIFCQGLVFRDASGWQLTAAGRDALHEMEAKERAVGGRRQPLLCRPRPPSLSLSRARFHGSCTPVRRPRWLASASGVD